MELCGALHSPQAGRGETWTDQPVSEKGVFNQ